MQRLLVICALGLGLLMPGCAVQDLPFSGGPADQNHAAPAPYRPQAGAVHDGSAQRNDGSAQRHDGSAQRNDGSAQRHDGSAQRNDGSAQRNDGSAQRNDGSGDGSGSDHYIPQTIPAHAVPMPTSADAPAQQTQSVPASASETGQQSPPAPKPTTRTATGLQEREL